MSNYKVVSSDNHVFEPPDLWVSRIEPRFRDRAPRVDKGEDGGDWWFCDGKVVQGTGFGFAGAQTGKRFEAPQETTYSDVFENVRPGGYIPEEHIKDMDIDGIDVSIIYPSAGLQLFKMADGELITAIFKVYNDWLAEFCQTSPKRLKGIALINTDDVEVGITELRRCKNMGFVGALITARPPEGRRYYSPEYEPLWATAQEVEMPLALHLETNRFGSGEADGTNPADVTLATVCNEDHFVRMSLAEMIYSGVLERYPKLQVGAVEFEVSWAAHFLDRLDYQYTQRSYDLATYRYKEDMLPSDYFHRNVFVGFQEDALGIRLRDIIGVDNLLWGADYPHMESTFPRSRQILEEILADCTEEEKAKIAGGNAARVYNLD
jgi:predicted TIM-barrel fold metal-dependent hydrolase